MVEAVCARTDDDVVVAAGRLSTACSPSVGGAAPAPFDSPGAGFERGNALTGQPRTARRRALGGGGRRWEAARTRVASMLLLPLAPERGRVETGSTSNTDTEDMFRREVW